LSIINIILHTFRWLLWKLYYYITLPSYFY